jgi:hypothetical protein
MRGLAPWHGHVRSRNRIAYITRLIPFARSLAGCSHVLSRRYPSEMLGLVLYVPAALSDTENRANMVEQTFASLVSARGVELLIGRNGNLH